MRFDDLERERDFDVEALCVIELFFLFLSLTIFFNLFFDLDRDFDVLLDRLVGDIDSEPRLLTLRLPGVGDLDFCL